MPAKGTLFHLDSLVKFYLMCHSGYKDWLALA